MRDFILVSLGVLAGVIIRAYKDVESEARQEAWRELRAAPDRLSQRPDIRALLRWEGQ